MAVLTTQARKALPGSVFAIPERRAYPIHDRRHAANALARVAQHGTPAEKARVLAAVKRRYPGMGRSKEGDIHESAAGGSMGGHDPRAFGKIRYIVRSFGTWAGGKHHICTKRLMAEHPEVAPTLERANALCAWLKDQWAGTTKWRGKGSDPKQKAQDLAIEARAKARHAMEMYWPDQADIDALYGRFMEMGFTVDDALMEALSELPASHDKQLIEQQVHWARTDPPEYTLGLLEQVEDKLYPGLRDEYLEECSTGGDYSGRRKKRLKKMARLMGKVKTYTTSGAWPGNITVTEVTKIAEGSLVSTIIRGGHHIDLLRYAADTPGGKGGQFAPKGEPPKVPKVPKGVGSKNVATPHMHGLVRLVSDYVASVDVASDDEGLSPALRTAARAYVAAARDDIQKWEKGLSEKTFSTKPQEMQSAVAKWLSPALESVGKAEGTGHDKRVANRTMKDVHEQLQTDLVNRMAKDRSRRRAYWRRLKQLLNDGQIEEAKQVASEFLLEFPEEKNNMPEFPEAGPVRTSWPKPGEKQVTASVLLPTEVGNILRRLEAGETLTKIAREMNEAGRQRGGTHVRGSYRMTDAERKQRGWTRQSLVRAIAAALGGEEPIPDATAEEIKRWNQRVRKYLAGKRDKDLLESHWYRVRRATRIVCHVRLREGLQFAQLVDAGHTATVMTGENT